MAKYKLIRASLLFLAKKTASEASGKHGGEQSELNKPYRETAPTPVIALSLTSPPLDLLNKSGQLNLSGKLIVFSNTCVWVTRISSQTPLLQKDNICKKGESVVGHALAALCFLLEKCW